MPSPKVSSESGEGDGADRNYWCGTVQSTWWFYYSGHSTDDVWKAYVAHCKAMLESRMASPSLVCIVHRADSPSAEQRKMLADFISSEATRLSSLVGFALVLDSPLHILALRAINWIVKKPFPETVCGSMSSAAMWLVERGARIDPQTLATELQEHVPEQHLVAF